MNSKLDPLMDALTCLSSENVKPCRMEMCPYFDTYNPNADWPCDIPEIAKAARARIQALEENVTKCPKLVLRCKKSFSKSDRELVRTDIDEQIASNGGAIIVSDQFDVIYAPEGTKVIVECK